MVDAYKNEKIKLISKLMESYILANESHSDNWLVEKFDKLYDMDIEALKYLASLRKVNLHDYVEY